MNAALPMHAEAPAGNYPEQAMRIFNPMTMEERGDSARMTFFVGAIAMGDLVKSTLGPRGMDKVLVGRENAISVTNDGATILKSVMTTNPAAKVLIDVAKTQDAEIGDGTTSVTVLCAELLREAERLVGMKIHPTIIGRGWRQAAELAIRTIEALAVDHRSDPVAFRADLMNVARTSLSSKLVGESHRELFAGIAVDAVTRLGPTPDLNLINVIKKPGESLAQSSLDEGFILEKRMGVGQPRRVENARILIANTAMDADKIKVFGSTLRVDSPEGLATIEVEERARMLEKVRKIRNHDINCFVNRQLIYNLPEQAFSDHGIMAIEHADFEGVERLAAATGGDIASTFDHPEKTRLGRCDLIEEILIGEDRVIRFSGLANSRACTVILRGGTDQILDEAERSLHDALCVVSATATRDGRVICGGGAPEAAAAAAVDKLAAATPGKAALAIEAFAKALRALPAAIADNAGLDGNEIIARLRAAHAAGRHSIGVDVVAQDVADMRGLGIVESLQMKTQVFRSATEAAEMILRVDELVVAPPRPRHRDGRG